MLPGIFDTDRFRSNVTSTAQKRGTSYDDALAANVNSVPARRLGTADEFGAACAFLCSTHAGYITGQNLLIDGGRFPASDITLFDFHGGLRFADPPYFNDQGDNTMKLVRYGAAGREKPGMIDKDGKLRDLSKHIDDLAAKLCRRQVSPASRSSSRKSCRSSKASSGSAPASAMSATSSPSD